ncbi:hypothetical protein OQA88_6993 [Cercophora sp. LCS_1]
MGSKSSKEEPESKQAELDVPVEAQDDDEPDEWDKRIFSTGCAAKNAGADENAKMTDCYYEKKDWRACKEEVSRFAAF